MSPDHVSVSQIKLWDTCPRQWEYRYIYKIPYSSTGALIFGDSYHYALEVNYKQKMYTQEDLPLSDFHDAFNERWKFRLSNDNDILWQGEDAGSLHDLGIALLTEYALSVSPFIMPKKVEEWFEDEVAGVRFVFRLDLQDINGIVIDHKTAKRAFSQSNIDDDMQASAAAFVLGRPIVYYNHIALKQRKPRIQLIKTIRYREDIEWWFEKATLTVLQMKSGLAPPRTDSWLCSPKYCSYWDMCRVTKPRSSFSSSIDQQTMDNGGNDASS